MSRTRNASSAAPVTDAPEQDTDAPEQDAPEQDAGADAPEQVAARGLASAARTEQVEKGARVYDVQHLTQDGEVITDAPDGSVRLSVPDVDSPLTRHEIHRERRADGSHGEMLCAVIVKVPGKPGTPARENVRRYPLSEVEAIRLAFNAASVPLFD